jgi:membrane fusion protein (multidrug efflux system)
MIMKVQDITKKFKNHRNIAYIAVSIILLIIYKIYVWSNTEATDNAYIDSEISTVSSQISGNVYEVLCADNQEVKQGAVLAKIDDTTYKATLTSAMAKRRSGEYALESIDQKIALERENLKKAQELIEFSKTNLDLATNDYQRELLLNKDKYSTQKALDKEKAALEKAKFDWSQANLSLEITKKNQEILNTQKLMTQLDLEILKQTQITAENDLKNTLITSPIDGVIASSGIRKGNYVRPGTPLVSIVPKQLFVKANFKETQTPHLAIGQEVIFFVDAVKAYSFHGKIRGIYPATGSKFSLIPTDNATGNFTKIVQRIPVIIDYDQAQEGSEMIRTGMSVNVKIRY